jgi:hypothetical protein
MQTLRKLFHRTTASAAPAPRSGGVSVDVSAAERRAVRRALATSS